MAFKVFAYFLTTNQSELAYQAGVKQVEWECPVRTKRSYSHVIDTPWGNDKPS